MHLEYLEAVEESELPITLHREAGMDQTEKREVQFYGPNLGYVLEPYERYREDPESVDERSQKYFETWNRSVLEENGHAPAMAGELFLASTALKRVLTKEIQKGEQVAVNFTFDVPPQHGHYSITTALRTESKDLDRVDATAAFEISHPVDRSPFRGVVHLPSKIKVHAPERKQQGRLI